MKTVGKLPVTAPLPWAPLLAYLNPRLTPGAERVTHDAYERRQGDTTLRVTFQAGASSLHVQADGPLDVDDARRRVARLFDVVDDARDARVALRDDPVIGPRLARLPGLRAMGAWCPFELCVRTVMGQQVTVAAAATLMQRLVARCGGLTPPSVLAADLSAMGMPGRRVATLRRLAALFADHPPLLATAPWPAMASALQTVAGIGPWTLAYLGIRLGRQADAFPHTDVGLIRAAGVASSVELLAMAEAWRPYRALAAIYLWNVP